MTKSVDTAATFSTKTFYRYTFRLYPNERQREYFAKNFGCCRYVYNYFLAKRKERHEKGEKSSLANDSKELTVLKKSLLHGWLNEANAQSLQQALADLDRAFVNFFEGRAGLPIFHKKGGKQSFRIPQKVEYTFGIRSKGKFRSLRIPKCSPIKMRTHQPIYGEVRSATIVLNQAGQYHVSLLVERHIAHLPPSDKEVGIDLGVKTLITCDDGKTYPNIRPYRTLEKRLQLLQRSYSRTQKGSKGRERARKKVAKLHLKVANIRKDHLHKTTKALIDENQVIVAETLNVGGMVRNRRMAKAVSDVSFGKILCQLEYKAKWYGREFIKVGSFFPSSKTCFDCGAKKEDLTLNDRKWTCRSCGVTHDRDINAAKNILREGKAVRTTVSAGGEATRPR